MPMHNSNTAKDLVVSVILGELYEAVQQNRNSNRCASDIRTNHRYQAAHAIVSASAAVFCAGQEQRLPLEFSRQIREAQQKI